MLEMPFSKLRPLGKDRLVEVLPVVVTSDGESFAIMAKPEDVIVLSNMHPIMRKRLKDLEAIARAGE